MTACRICRAGALEPVLSLGEQPLANAFLDDASLGQPEARFPLNLVFCRSCSLIQLRETVAPERLFVEYPYFSSISDAFVDHARALARRVALDQRLDEASLVVEIGSNDGYLLRQYDELGIPVLGVDPAANIAGVATERGIPTIADFFGAELADELRETGRSADVIHANNVIAHVPDIHGVVGGLSTLLKHEGVAIIETPYVRDMVDGVEFDTIYHEHVFYYSLHSLVRVLGDHGLKVIDVEHLAVHGGSLRVTAAHDTSPLKSGAAVRELLRQESQVGVDTLDYYRDFATRVDCLGGDLRALLLRLRSEGRSVAAYGAAAKGTVLLNAFDIGTEFLDFVADRSPHKQGLYMPGVHVPIVRAEDLLEKAPTACLLLAWNFADEILTQQQAYRDKGGRFIVPAPQVRLLD